MKKQDLDSDSVGYGVDENGNHFINFPRELFKEEHAANAAVTCLILPEEAVAAAASLRFSMPLVDIPALMERPFFAVAKKPPRQLPPYVSPGSGNLILAVRALDPNLGVATLRDAEILMVVIGLLAQRLNHKESLNEPVELSARDLLIGIGRQTGGRQYELLKESLERLRCTEMTTNIGPTGTGTSLGAMHLVESWSLDRSGGLTVRVSDWVLAAIEAKSVLKIDPGYLDLPAGYSRWLYRVARKHAGHKAEGWSGKVEMLWRKAGSTSPLSQFRVKVREIVSRDALPGYTLSWIDPQGQRRQPEVLMRPRD